MGRRDENMKKTHPESALDGSYPLAQNQCINNSPRVFFLYSRGCECRRGMYSYQHDFPQEFVNFAENPFSNIFACIHTKINSPRVFPACIGFVPGVIGWVLERSLIFAVTSDRDARQKKTEKASLTSRKDMFRSFSH